MKDIIIFSGQSNMQGQTEAVMSAEPVARALEYRFGRNELIPLAHPVGETVGDGLLWGAHEGHGSLIPDFCRAYVEGTGHDVVAVHASRGATMICEWLPGTARFDALIAKCRAAVEAVQKTDTVGRMWFIWLQGESDAVASVTGEDYKSMMCAFREALLRELPLAGFCFIRVGKFAGDARDIAIIRAQEELCETEDFAMLTRLTGVCTNDPARWLNPYAAGHYNNAAMTLIGRAAGEHLADLAEGRAYVLEDEPYGEMKA